MTIEENKVVSLTYELRVNDENGDQELVETVESDQPMTFLYGMSGLPEMFEAYLAGKGVGEAFEFSIPPEEGYGDYDPDDVVELPLNIFEVDGQVDEEMLQPGNILPMTDQEGHQVDGRVVSVGQETVRMDFNHLLAGKFMHFTGQVLAIREATQAELDHGHVHGAGGVEH